MANKTQLNDACVDTFLVGVKHSLRRENAQQVTDMMRRITGMEPNMWGDSLIGFGSLSYTYANGKAGEWFVLGVSPRKQALTLYIMSGFDVIDDYLGRLGKFKLGRCCLYINNLDDIDIGVLEEMLEFVWLTIQKVR
jgi:hypothetical protein